VFESSGTGTTVTYEVGFYGDAADFGWIVPIPGTFVAMVDADPARIDDLRSATAPAVEYEPEPESRSCGCGPTSGDGDLGDRNGAAGDSGELGDIDVTDQGFTGTYEYVVLTASGSSSELVDWLTTNGWTVGDAGPALDHYVAQGDGFVAIRVLPEAVEEIDGLPPVSITYDGPMRFPAFMAQYAAPAEQRTTVFVVGTDRATVSGWASEDLARIDAPFDSSPTEEFESAVRTHGAETAYAVTFAGSVGGEFVTRFDTIAPREKHTADATFAGGGGATEVRTLIHVAAENGSWMFLLPLAPMLVGLGAALRRRI
jgi:hypothetical protein